MNPDSRGLPVRVRGKVWWKILQAFALKRAKTPHFLSAFFASESHFSEPERQVFRGEWCVIADNFVPLHAKSGFFARPKTSATAVEQGFQGV